MERICITALFFVVFAWQSFSQEISVPEPEFTGIVLLVKPDGQAEQLEKQKAASASRADIGAALFGVSKAKGMNMVSGVQSPVRNAASEKLAFIVRVKENDRDPVEVINLFRMEVDLKKERRTIVTGTVNFNQTTAADIEFIPFHASKYGQNSYLVQVSDLTPGEYALTLDGSRDVFNLFGID